MSKALRTTAPNPDWSKILALLAYKNSNDYMGVSQFVLNHETIEVPKTDLSSNTQPATRNQRNLRKKRPRRVRFRVLKQAVPIASGVYGYVSGDIESAFQLSSLIDPKRASQYVGSNLAQPVSKAAIAGLAIASANSSSEKNQNIAALTQALFQIENDKTAKVLSNTEYAFTNKSTEETAKQATGVYRSTINKEQAAFMNKVYNQVKENGLDNFVQNGIE